MAELCIYLILTEIGLRAHLQVKGAEGKTAQTGRDVLDAVVQTQLMNVCLDEVRLLLPTTARATLGPDLLL